MSIYIPSNSIFRFDFDKRYETLPTENISLCVVFILSASPENTRKVFKYLRRMRGKYLSAYGECAESI
jgi:hypothetical protein